MAKNVHYPDGVMRSMQNDVFVGMYADKPVAMFALLPDDEFQTDLLKLQGATQPPIVKKLCYEC